MAIAILAGGASQRMGQDKAMLPLGSATFLAHTVEVASQITQAIVVVGRERPDTWQYPDVQFLPDEQPGSGPLGGLLTALRYASDNVLDGVLLVACDMPALNPAVFQWLIDAAQDAGPRQGCIAVNGGQLEPLFGVYFTSVLGAVEKQLAKNRRALHRLIENGDFKIAPVPEALSPALLNLNTPEEFAHFVISARNE